MNNELHEVQASILRELLFKNGTNFASLNKLGLTNDHFTFHINRLLKEEIIEKKGRAYFLTQKGKQFASKLDIDALVMEKFGTPGVAVTAQKMIKGVPHYLIQQRLKEPMYGFYGFVNGKIRFGEFSVDTAKRELKEETGLSGTPTFVTIHHRLRGPVRSEIKLDHFFFVYIAKNPKGKLKDTKEGKNYWMTVEEIKKLKTFPGFEYSLNAVLSEKPSAYMENYIQVDEI
jgi:ADP-ribose pyrophosphatase YjhB (NUDIX family)/predicted transcriptional regulator